MNEYNEDYFEKYVEGDFTQAEVEFLKDVFKLAEAEGMVFSVKEPANNSYIVNEDGTTQPCIRWKLNQCKKTPLLICTKHSCLCKCKKRERRFVKKMDRLFTQKQKKNV